MLPILCNHALPTLVMLWHYIEINTKYYFTLLHKAKFVCLIKVRFVSRKFRSNVLMIWWPTCVRTGYSSEDYIGTPLGESTQAQCENWSDTKDTDRQALLMEWKESAVLEIKEQMIFHGIFVANLCRASYICESFFLKMLPLRFHNLNYHSLSFPPAFKIIHCLGMSECVQEVLEGGVT